MFSSLGGFKVLSSSLPLTLPLLWKRGLPGGVREGSGAGLLFPPPYLPYVRLRSLGAGVEMTGHDLGPGTPHESSLGPGVGEVESSWGGLTLVVSTGVCHGHRVPSSDGGLL